MDYSTLCACLGKPPSALDKEGERDGPPEGSTRIMGDHVKSGFSHTCSRLSVSLSASMSPAGPAPARKAHMRGVEYSDGHRAEYRGTQPCCGRVLRSARSTLLSTQLDRAGYSVEYSAGCGWVRRNTTPPRSSSQTNQRGFELSRDCTARAGSKMGPWGAK